MSVWTPKRRYSGKVRALGAGIILLELATVVLFLLAVYSNGLVVSSIVSSVISSSGNGFGFKNVKSSNQVQQTIELPGITNKAYLPVTVSLSAVLLDSQGHSIGNVVSQSSTINPGQTQPLTLLLPNLSGSNVHSAHFSFQISSLYGLVGGGIEGTVYPSGAV